MTALPVAHVAAPLDAAAYGEFRPTAARGAAFSTRVRRDDPVALSALPPISGRYHLYAAANSPASHRLELIRLLAGLEHDVSVSHLDPVRDARGWAFRGPTGPDPVNGFTLLRQAYERTVPGYHGPVRVPLLWDRATRRIVSDDDLPLGIDMATQFASGSRPAGSLYPAAHAAEIERISAGVQTGFTDLLGRALADDHAAARVRATLLGLDRRLATRRFLLGDDLTDADLLVWPVLVRYDVGINAHRTIGPPLLERPALWRYARELAELPAFRATTRYEAFAAPLHDVSAWTA